MRSARPAAATAAALAGHELGTPIATALLYLGIAECHAAALQPNGLLRSALGVAKSEILRLKRLLDRVTELEQLGAPRMRPQAIDLGKAVRATVERTLLAGARKGDVTVVSQAGLFGWWDELAVEQIVSNLLSNALKFGSDRGVRVAVEPAPGGGRILVSDQGQGIRAGARQRIFDRGHRSPPERHGGMGLGLWIVRELARAHGGRVTVHSRSGRGATVVVHLSALAPPSGASVRVQSPAAYMADRRPEVGAFSAPAGGRPTVMLLPGGAGPPTRRGHRRRADPLPHHA